MTSDLLRRQCWSEQSSERKSAMSSFGCSKGVSRCVVCEYSIDEQQERCRSRTVGNCDAKARDRIDVSYAAIQREWSKFCYSSPPPEQAPANIGTSYTLRYRVALANLRD